MNERNKRGKTQNGKWKIARASRYFGWIVNLSMYKENGVDVLGIRKGIRQ